MTEQRPDTQFEVGVRLLLNLGGAVIVVGLIVLVIATIIHEAG